MSLGHSSSLLFQLGDLSLSFCNFVLYELLIAFRTWIAFPTAFDVLPFLIKPGSFEIQNLSFELVQLNLAVHRVNFCLELWHFGLNFLDIFLDYLGSPLETRLLSLILIFDLFILSYNLLFLFELRPQSSFFLSNLLYQFIDLSIQLVGWRVFDVSVCRHSLTINKSKGLLISGLLVLQ